MSAEAMTDSGLVTHSVADGVAVLTWNRPERNNAWTVDMELEYFRLLDECAHDPAVRVIVVTGAGRSFCPGMDAQVLAENARKEATTSPHLRTPFTMPRSIPKPIIAAINGACAGIGFVAAMNCDLRFASSTAKLTTSFAHRGIMAEHGIAWSLPRAVGVSTALDLLFSARVIMAPEAKDLGVVDRVYEPDDLMNETMSYARNLAQYSSPLAMGVMKRQVYEAQESSHEEARTLALRYWMGILCKHPDFLEGMNSFLEKRPPDFAPWDMSTPSSPPPLPTT